MACLASHYNLLYYYYGMGDFLYKSDSDNLQIIKSSKTVIIDLSTLSFFKIDLEAICADGLVSEIMAILFSKTEKQSLKYSIISINLLKVVAFFALPSYNSVFDFTLTSFIIKLR